MPFRTLCLQVLAADWLLETCFAMHFQEAGPHSEDVGFCGTHSLDCSPFRELPYRILTIQLANSPKRTTMETGREFEGFRGAEFSVAAFASLGYVGLEF